VSFKIRREIAVGLESNRNATDFPVLASSQRVTSNGCSSWPEKQIKQNEFTRQKQKTKDGVSNHERRSGGRESWQDEEGDRRCLIVEKKEPSQNEKKSPAERKTNMVSRPMYEMRVVECDQSRGKQS